LFSILCRLRSKMQVMCGIVGYVGQQTAKHYLLDGLKRLEYRGYDSAGIALHSKSDFTVKRNAGPVAGLIQSSEGLGQTERMGIAHTRWATHGAPTENNAHPHRAGNLVLVHNGIIENYSEIKNLLMTSGVDFSSQTDTEVFAQLIEFNRKKIIQKTPEIPLKDLILQALKTSMKEVEGHYAILLMVKELPGTIFGIQNGAPLVASIIKDGCLIASDIQAIIPYHNVVSFLPKGSMFIAESGALQVLNSETGKPFENHFETIHWTSEAVEKDGFETFMMKEIFQQPMVVADTLSGRIAANEPFWKSAKRLYIVACGTSYHAALTAKYFFEKWAQLDCQIDIASEFRYRNPILDPGTVVGVISQSGETADTLAAMRLAKESGVTTFSICNVPNSTIARESDFQFPTKAGPEIGVASTKAFTAQLTILCALAHDIALIRGKKEMLTLQSLARLPHDIARILEQKDSIIALGEKVKSQRIILFVGRGTMFPIALEGALKFKELTYLPAEGFAAGELKHGPIAYIDPQVTTVVIAPKDEWYSKTISNLEEIKARGGHIISIGTEGDHTIQKLSDEFIGLPKSDLGTMPILSVIPLQLLAYGCAKALGRNIDKPRNLAKSVTVE
jgi:glucosamine--fructose-6-phosphate aminotransferase (isomerizing)